MLVEIYTPGKVLVMISWFHNDDPHAGENWADFQVSSTCHDNSMHAERRPPLVVPRRE